MVNKDTKIKNRVKDLLKNQNNLLVDGDFEICQALLDDFVKDRKRLDSILKSADKREARLKKTAEQLEILFQKASKMAVIGEMIDAVAHQWTQPLGIISLYTKMLPEDYKYGEINDKYLDNFTNKIEIQIEYLLETLHEFRNFFRPDKELTYFYISEIIKGVSILLQDVIKGNQIELIINIKNDFMLFGAKNEFKHVIINLINNTKDIFIERNIKNRQIKISIEQNNQINYINFYDNGKGIPEHILPKIFNLNFSTKEAKGGTGVGLYLSKRIIQKLGGELKAFNWEDGAKFQLSFKNSIESL
jgi:signal transduction histidine kinase